MKDDTKQLALAGLLLLGGSVVGGLFGYGIYGSLKERGWSPWKAGAVSGLLGGISTAGLLVITSLATGRPLIPPLKSKELAP